MRSVYMNNLFKKIHLVLVTLLLSLGGCGNNDSFDSSSVDEPSEVAYTQKSLINFAVYYGWPGSLNSATLGWGVSQAKIDFINQYDLIVLGGGLEDPGHGDYANTAALAPGVHSSVEAFGYVNLGNTDSFSVATMRGKIDQWVALGVEGIFLDEFGFDFWGGTDAEMRTRQNTMIDYIHSKGISAFVNAWDPDDIFIKEAGNPTTLTNGDYYLAESYVFNSNGMVSFANHLVKTQKIRAAKDSTGVKALGLSTTLDVSGDFEQSDFDFMAIAAQLEGLDGVSWGTLNFSASGADNAVMPYRSFSSQYNNIKLTGSNEVNINTETISRGNIDSQSVNTNFSTQTFNIQ